MPKYLKTNVAGATLAGKAGPSHFLSQPGDKVSVSELTDAFVEGVENGEYTVLDEANNEVPMYEIVEEGGSESAEVATSKARPIAGALGTEGKKLVKGS